MAVLLENNAAGRLALSINTTQTTINLQSGSGSLFPNPGSGDWFPITIVGDGGELEIAHCTSRDGDSLTVSRGAEGTQAREFYAGNIVELRLTKAVHDALKAADGANAQAIGTLDSAKLSKAENLGDLDDAEEARGNLGLGYDDLKWINRALGEEVWLDDSNPAVDVPPTDNSSFRFIKLTAGENGPDGYNEGVLINENVSGSAPLIEATAEVNLPDSPLHGQTVHLLNTERRFIRAGEAGVAQDDQMQRITGQVNMARTGMSAAEGAISSQGVFSDGSADGSSTGHRFLFDSAGSPDARTSETTDGETRPRNIGRTIYMRIL